MFALLPREKAVLKPGASNRGWHARDKLLVRRHLAGLLQCEKKGFCFHLFCTQSWLVFFFSISLTIAAPFFQSAFAQKFRLAGKKGYFHARLPAAGLASGFFLETRFDAVVWLVFSPRRSLFESHELRQQCFQLNPFVGSFHHAKIVFADNVHQFDFCFAGQLFFRDFHGFPV